MHEKIERREEARQTHRGGFERPARSRGYKTQDDARGGTRSSLARADRFGRTFAEWSRNRPRSAVRSYELGQTFMNR